LRPYDVTASPPVLIIGKKHPYLEFLEEVKEILISMGFEETVGPYVESEFWNFDALYQAQEHPARAVHDNFRVGGPVPNIDAPIELINAVKKTHENGGLTGSKGWRYKWSIDIAKQQVLRTQTTAVSVRTLFHRREPPVKTFCLSKVFRPDAIDSSHMIEFSQLDGILGDRGINVRHLLGILSEFAKQLGFKEIKFTPGYFPFTEPSIEAYAKHPKMGWIECLGSGLFRPEVLAPLGINFPVIAWGIGIDRLAMIRLGLDDIRDLHSMDLGRLREWGWR
jgi:phenylalanyl-tRNA synthetase alpha chain